MKWWTVLVAVFGLAAPVLAESHAPVPVKGPDGKQVAVIVTCNDCENPNKAGCFPGAENGYLDGKPCGQCYLIEGDRKVLAQPFDLHVTGKITDAEGKAVKDRFLKLFLPNGWGHRTRTGDDGTFHLLLGATAERTSKEPVTVNLGTLHDSIGTNDEFFALYMLPTNFAPCKQMGPPHKQPRP